MGSWESGTGGGSKSRSHYGRAFSLFRKCDKSVASTILLCEPAGDHLPPSQGAHDLSSSPASGQDAPLRGSLPSRSLLQFLPAGESFGCSGLRAVPHRRRDRRKGCYFDRKNTVPVRLRDIMLLDLS